MIKQRTLVAVALIALCLVMGLVPPSNAYDASIISTVEATVYDDAGDVAAIGGPWNWTGWLWIITGIPTGPENTLELVARDDTGNALYAGSLSDVEIIPDFPAITGSLILTPSPDGINVLAPPFTDVGVVILLPIKVDVLFDISPNSFNIKAKGKLPAIIAGAPDVDVTDIEAASLTLLGVPVLKVSTEDVVTWRQDGDEAPVTEEGSDGLPDLVLHFDRQALASAIGKVSGGDAIGMVLEGNLNGGTPVEGLDFVTITPKGEK